MIACQSGFACTVYDEYVCIIRRILFWLFSSYRCSLLICNSISFFFFSFSKLAITAYLTIGAPQIYGTWGSNKYFVHFMGGLGEQKQPIIHICSEKPAHFPRRVTDLQGGIPPTCVVHLIHIWIRKFGRSGCLGRFQNMEAIRLIRDVERREKDQRRTCSLSYKAWFCGADLGPEIGKYGRERKKRKKKKKPELIYIPHGSMSCSPSQMQHQIRTTGSCFQSQQTVRIRQSDTMLDFVPLILSPFWILLKKNLKEYVCSYTEAFCTLLPSCSGRPPLDIETEKKRKLWCPS